MSASFNGTNKTQTITVSLENSNSGLNVDVVTVSSIKDKEGTAIQSLTDGPITNDKIPLTYTPPATPITQSGTVEVTVSTKITGSSATGPTIHGSFPISISAS